MICDDITKLVTDDVCLKLNDYADGLDVFMKIEAFNAAGSIMLKTALGLVNDLEHQGRLRRGMGIVKSSSGNLDVALALVCLRRGYRFICVGDPNMVPANAALIRTFGGQIDVVSRHDADGGFLANRIQRVSELLKYDRSLVWVGQYGNPSGLDAHCRGTAAALFTALGKVDYLFVGTDIAETLMGCARYIGEAGLGTQLIAVDAAGSVPPNGRPGTRLLPGIDTSRRPELPCDDWVDDVVTVSEADAIRTCHEAVRRWGYIGGPSTGSVLAGLASYLPHIPRPARIAVISPDMGGPYLDTVYSANWVARNFSPNPLTPRQSSAVPLPPDWGELATYCF